MITQVSLLTNVAAGEVWLNEDGSSELTCMEMFGVSDPIADVTAECATAETAGLIRRPGAHDTTWRLTADGEAAL